MTTATLLPDSIRRGRIVSAPGPTGLVAVALTDALDCARCTRGNGCQRLSLIAEHPLTIDCRLPSSGAEPTGELASPIGQSVDIAMPSQGSAWLLPVAIAYGLPTATLVLGCVLAERAIGVAPAAAALPAAALGALAGLVGLMIGIRVSRRLLSRLTPAAGSRPCPDVPRIVSVAAARPPSPTGAPVDDDPA